MLPGFKQKEATRLYDLHIKCRQVYWTIRVGQKARFNWMISNALLLYLAHLIGPDHAFSVKQKKAN